MVERNLDLSKEVLCVSVGQRATEVQAVKIEVKKNSADWLGAVEAGSNQADCSSAAL